MDSWLETFKLLWHRWYVKAAVVISLVAVVVWFVALKPTYTADEVTKKMKTYLEGKVYSTISDSRYETFTSVPRTISCSQVVGQLSSPHYIPYRKAWRIKTVTHTTTHTIYPDSYLDSQVPIWARGSTPESTLEEINLQRVNRGLAPLPTPTPFPTVTISHNKNIIWLFDERTGTIASSDPRC